MFTGYYKNKLDIILIAVLAHIKQSRNLIDYILILFYEQFKLIWMIFLSY